MLRGSGACPSGAESWLLLLVFCSAAAAPGSPAPSVLRLPAQRHASVPFVRLAIRSTAPTVQVEALHHFDAQTCEWNVTCAGGEMVSVKPESLVLERSSIADVWVRIAGLQKQQGLNGKLVKLMHYQAEMGRFLVRGGQPADPSPEALFLGEEEAVHVRPENLQYVQSVEPGSRDHLEAPFVVAPSSRLAGESAVFASRDFEPGEVIFEELAVLRCPAVRQTGDLSRGFTCLCSKFDALPKDMQEQFLSMTVRAGLPREVTEDIERRMKAAGLEPTPDRVLLFLVWLNNSFADTDGLTHLFLYICRMNHCCAPNAYMHVTATNKRLQALRSIKSGEEITISYLPTVEQEKWRKPFHMRQQRLQKWFNACACPRCGEETDDTRQFPCPSECGGVCLAYRGTASIGECGGCGRTHSQQRSQELIEIENRLWDLLCAAEREGGALPQLQAHALVAKSALAPGHWELWEADYLVGKLLKPGASDVDQDLFRAISGKQELGEVPGRYGLKYGDHFASRGRYPEALFVYLRALNKMTAHDEGFEEMFARAEALLGQLRGLSSPQ